MRSAEERLEDVLRLLNKLPVGGANRYHDEDFEARAVVALADLTAIQRVGRGETDPADWVSVPCGMTLFGSRTQIKISHSPHHWTEWLKDELSSQRLPVAVHWCDGELEKE